MLVTAAAAVACSKENIEDGGNRAKEVNYIEASFNAAPESADDNEPVSGTADTKTAVNISTGDVSWTGTDCISVFDNSTAAEQHNNKFTHSGESVFSGTLPEDATEFYALYPYDADASFNQESKAITATLSSEQAAAAGTVADGTAVMAGKVSENSISFKNICSHIGFTIAEDITDVKSITLMGNASEALCGTFTIGWNADEPVITLTKPETYVTLRNADGNALAPGTYWFTVLPVNFSKGFTVTLSKTDGSQKAKSLNSAVTKVASRNKILPLETLSASQYEDKLNYFIRYNDGFPVAIGNADEGGVTFTKETNPGGVLVNSTAGNTTIQKDGVYFICDEDTPAKISYNAMSDLIVCGAESSTRSKIEFGKTLQPATNASGNLLFENLIITPAESFGNNDFIGQKRADADPGTEFGAIVFDNCTMTTARHLICILNKVTSIGKISVLNCDYFSKNAQACIVTLGNLASTVSELNIRNNVFCNAAGVTMTDFKVLQAPSATVSNINAYSNTFDHTTMVNAGCIIVYGVENCYIMYNLCNETVLTTKASNLGNYKGTASSINGSVVNNYYYTSGSYTLNNSLRPTQSGTPVKLSASPLSSEWNPAGGVYGTYSINAVDAAKQPGEALLTLIGAKRADMTSTSTASAQ